MKQGQHHVRQRGATLVVSLILLIVLTLLVTATLMTSSTNLRVVGNMQAQRQLEAMAQQAIEARITNFSFFQDAIDNTGVWAAGAPKIESESNKYKLTVYRPQCVYTVSEPGTSALLTLVPEITVWEVRATAVDTVTQGRADVTQGVRMRLLAGNCPP